MIRRRSIRYLLLFTCLTACSAAQELQPRAYLPAPVGLNYFGVSYSKNKGGLLLDPALTLGDAPLSAHVSTLAFGQTLGLAGRTVQLLACLPYVVAKGESSFGGGGYGNY